MRTIVDLSEEDLKAIKSLAKRQKVSQAETIRRAVRDYLEVNRGEQPDAAAFGLWAGREDGLVYQQMIRDEWER